MPAIELDGEIIRFTTENGVIFLDGGTLKFEILGSSEGRLLVKVGDKIREIVYTITPDGVVMTSAEGKSMVRVLTDRELLIRGFQADRSAYRSHTDIKAPMPGLVVKVLVKIGDKVKRGSTLAILEAMKMENEIRAAQDAEIGEILVKNGEIVEKDQVIFRLR